MQVVISRIFSKFLVMVLSIGICTGVFANHSQATGLNGAIMPWVVDDRGVLSQNTYDGLTHILSGAAQKSNIYVRLIITDIQKNELIKQRMIEWEAKNPRAHLKETIYLIVNTAHQECWTIMGDNVRKSPALDESIKRIESEIVRRALKKGYPEKAVGEGVIALITVLDDWALGKRSSFSPPESPWYKEYFVFLLVTGLGFLYVIWIGLRRYIWLPKSRESKNLERQEREDNMMLYILDVDATPEEKELLQ